MAAASPAVVQYYLLCRLHQTTLRRRKEAGALLFVCVRVCLFVCLFVCVRVCGDAVLCCADAAAVVLVRQVIIITTTSHNSILSRGLWQRDQKRERERDRETAREMLSDRVVW